MGSASVQGLNLSAGCPSGVVVVSMAALRGTAGYTLVNSGDSDAIVHALAEMADDRGASTSDDQGNLLISAGSSQQINHVLSLSSRYDDVGLVTVTVKVTVRGDASLSDSTFCTFIVNQ